MNFKTSQYLTNLSSSKFVKVVNLKFLDRGSLIYIFVSIHDSRFILFWIGDPVLFQLETPKRRHILTPFKSERLAYGALKLR